MFEQIDTGVKGISEEESVDQNTSADTERDDFDNEELTNGNVNMENADNSYFSEEIRAESGLVINMAQVQSIDIPEQFSQRRTKDGWEITVHQWCKVTINMAVSMRKTDIPMLTGDKITKSGEELFVLHNSPAGEYKTKKSTSSLALGREEVARPELCGVPIWEARAGGLPTRGVVHQRHCNLAIYCPEGVPWDVGGEAPAFIPH